MLYTLYFSDYYTIIDDSDCNVNDYLNDTVSVIDKWENKKEKIGNVHKIKPGAWYWNGKEIDPDSIIGLFPPQLDDHFINYWRCIFE